MTHLTFEQISELAESRVPQADSREHLAACAECRATLERVQRLIQAAHALPRDIAPPPEIWSQLRTKVKAGGTIPRSRSWNLGWLAAAAAIVFLVGSALLLPPSIGKSKGKGTETRPPSTNVAVVSPVVLAVEDCYSPAIRDLRRTLDQQRGTLAPATLSVVERSLVTIDDAIAEARAALASDPANQALVQILSAQFEHKVELLQRATQLSSS